jgi:putative nucleotidyltransferase with HDIG domain
MVVPMTREEGSRRTAVIMDLLARAHSQEYIGESVSQLEHGLQAAFWASEARQDEVVILAALLHDVGHLVDTTAPQMDGLGTLDHEELGAVYLRALGCSKALAHLVRSHVLAKRYLCYRTENYWARLSPASQGTLEWQGGPMNRDEAVDFEGDPWFEVILRMRVFDEKAKDPHMVVPDLEHYRPVLCEHIMGRSVGEGITC